MSRLMFQNIRGDYIFVDFSKISTIQFSYFSKEDEYKYQIEINDSAYYVPENVFKELKGYFLNPSETLFSFSGDNNCQIVKKEKEKKPSLNYVDKLKKYFEECREEEKELTNDPYSFNSTRYGFKFMREFESDSASLSLLRNKYPFYTFFPIKDLNGFEGLLVIHVGSQISYRSFKAETICEDAKICIKKIKEDLLEEYSMDMDKEEKTKVKMHLNSNPWDPRHVEYNEDGQIKSVTIDFHTEESEDEE